MSDISMLLDINGLYKMNTERSKSNANNAYGQFLHGLTERIDCVPKHAVVYSTFCFFHVKIIFKICPHITLQKKHKSCA